MGGITPNNEVYRYSKHRVSSVLRCGYCNAPFVYREKPVKRKGRKRVRIKQYTLPAHDKDKCSECPKIIRNFDADILEGLFDHLYFLYYLNQEEVFHNHILNFSTKLDPNSDINLEIENHITNKISEYINSKNSLKRELLLKHLEGHLTKRSDNKDVLKITYFGLSQSIDVFIEKNTARLKKYNFIISITSDLYQDERFFYDTNLDRVFYHQVDNIDLLTDLNNINFYIENV